MIIQSIRYNLESTVIILYFAESYHAQCSKKTLKDLGEFSPLKNNFYYT
jgi:hypothetical protein